MLSGTVSILVQVFTLIWEVLLNSADCNKYSGLFQIKYLFFTLSHYSPDSEYQKGGLNPEDPGNIVILFWENFGMTFKVAKVS